MYMSETNPKLTLVDLTDNTQVNSGGSTNTQTLQPTAGFYYIVRNIYYTAAAPVGDTAGTHELQIYWNDGLADRQMALIRGNHSTSIYTNATGFVGDSSELPANASEQLRVLHDFLIATNDYPINFIYKNDTDAHQTGTRTLTILVEKHRQAL